MTQPRNTTDKGDALPTGKQALPNPEEVNEFHRYDDSDNNPEAHHHTLGIDPNQASPGDHNHDGRNSKLISGSSGGSGSSTGSMVNAQLVSQNLNDQRQSGYYDCNNCTNSPDAAIAWFHVLHLNHNNNNGYVVQLAWRLDAADKRRWRRQNIAGTWSSWYVDNSYPGNPIASADAGALDTGTVGLVQPVASVSAPLVSGRRYLIELEWSTSSSGHAAASAGGAGVYFFGYDPSNVLTFDMVNGGDEICTGAYFIPQASVPFFGHRSTAVVTATSTGNFVVGISTGASGSAQWFYVHRILRVYDLG